MRREKKITNPTTRNHYENIKFSRQQRTKPKHNIPNEAHLLLYKFKFHNNEEKKKPNPLSNSHVAVSSPHWRKTSLATKSPEQQNLYKNLLLSYRCE